MVFNGMPNRTVVSSRTFYMTLSATLLGLGRYERGYVLSNYLALSVSVIGLGRCAHGYALWLQCVLSLDDIHGLALRGCLDPWANDK